MADEREGFMIVWEGKHCLTIPPPFHLIFSHGPLPFLMSKAHVVGRVGVRASHTGSDPRQIVDYSDVDLGMGPGVAPADSIF